MSMRAVSMSALCLLRGGTGGKIPPVRAGVWGRLAPADGARTMVNRCGRVGINHVALPLSPRPCPSMWAWRGADRTD